MKKFLKYVFGIFIAFHLLLVLIGIEVYRFSKVDQTRRADVAIVLGASAWDARPSPVFEERIKHSIKLYQQGFVKKIVFTGGKSEGARFSEAYVGRRYAIKHGVKEKDIFIEEHSRNTVENFKYADIILKENGFKSVLIVSDPTHMKRSMKIASRYDFRSYTSPTRTSKFTSMRKILPFIGYEAFFYLVYSVMP